MKTNDNNLRQKAEMLLEEKGIRKPEIDSHESLLSKSTEADAIASFR